MSGFSNFILGDLIFLMFYVFIYLLLCPQKAFEKALKETYPYGTIGFFFKVG